MEKFEKLGMSKELLDVIKKAGFEKPSEIQEKAIPLAMEGKDIIGGSATGSGKTFAFSTPIIEKLVPNQHVQALVMCPTRELAEQVSESINFFARNKKLNVLSVYGGVSIEPQIRKLAIADVVVGTPGRILDHINRKTLRLDEVKFLVLDEVDRMFDMGFQKDVQRILRECPEERQTMLFSATISNDIDYLAHKYTKDAVEVSVESYVDHSKLEQVYYDVPSRKKFSLLVHLLKDEKSELVMVFCNTRSNVDFVEKNLKKNGVDAIAIHGGLSQNQRSRVIKKFHGEGVHVLVCTDVAARGLDIKGVSHVYNYDTPADSADYVHRIGRTARAGEKGKAITILSDRDYDNFRRVKRNDDLKIKPLDLPEIEIVSITVPERKHSGGRGFGGRGRSFGGRSKNSGRYSGNSGRYSGSRSYGRESRSDSSSSSKRPFHRSKAYSRDSKKSYSNRSSNDSRKSYGNSSRVDRDKPRRSSGREGFRGRKRSYSDRPKRSYNKR